MPSANKFVEDLSRVISGAAGVAQGALHEAENAIKSRAGRGASAEGQVSREEFNAVADMAKKARAENAELRQEIEALKAQIAGDAPKPAKKAKAASK